MYEQKVHCSSSSQHKPHDKTRSDQTRSTQSNHMAAHREQEAYQSGVIA